MVSEIIQTIATRLNELYPATKVYDEYINQGFKPGTFYIDQVDFQHSKKIMNKSSGEVKFNLSYFPSTKNINTECTEVKETIMRDFDLIGGFKITDKAANVTDDVLHIQFTVKYKEIKVETGTKMNDIKF